MFTSRRPYTPSPSPPSSPSIGPIDSSPPSSPSLNPTILDSSPSQVPHPFAASTKANRRPPQYEWRIGTPPSTPPGIYSLMPKSPTVSRYRVNADPFDDDDYMSDESHASTQLVDPEQRVWDEAITAAVDTGNGTIELRPVASSVSCP